MNLRNVTIWTTGVMLIATFVPIMYVLVIEGFPSQLFEAFFFMSMLWLVSGSPMLISFVIARRLKSATTPSVILLISTVAFGLWFIYWWSLVMPDPRGCNGFIILGIGLGSLWWMLPAWIIAMVLNAHYTKKSLADSENQSDK